MTSNNTKNLFESMTRRRVSCPQITQQLWDAIKSIRSQRQVPTAERIQKTMLKEFCVSEEEVMRQLNHCVRDGLIEITKRTINKGNYIGSEQEGYKLPLLSLKPDDFDWYCFDCHRAGDVICCSKPNCLRVYHLACISSTELPEGNFICHVCKMCEVTPDKFQMKKSKLNRLLGYTLQRLKSKYPLTLKDQRIPPPNKNVLVSDRLAQVLTPPTIPSPDESEAWRTQLLIAREMNLTIMEDKIDRHRYKLLEEFHVDALNIVHNMVIYNGVDSAVADIARQMLRDCVQDLHEIRQCVDCYKQSHGEKKKLWFCKPCRKPHELVYAKQFGFPYWPAKVIKVEDDQYDVRFFGAQHLRAMIPKAHIRPISVNIHTLQVKRSSAWNRACEELKKHQELLEKARIATDNFTKYIDSSSSSEYESINSEDERRIERENRLKKQKAIMEKHNSLLSKQKSKRRRSSSVVPNAKTIENLTSKSKKKKKANPKPNESVSVAAKPAKNNKKKKETYEFSSDSLDSFSFNNSSKSENFPKKNSDEIFDELLKSGAEKPKGSGKSENGKSDTSKEEGMDMKMKNWLGVDIEESNRLPRSCKVNKSTDKKDKKTSVSSDFSDDEDDSVNKEVKKLKSKTETFDSSTMSSVDTVDSKKKGSNNKGGTFGLKEQNQNLSFEKIARSHKEGLKETGNEKKKSSTKIGKKIYSSSSEADESDLSSNDDSDSDYVGDKSGRVKSKSKVKKFPSKGKMKKMEPQKSVADVKANSKASGLDSDDTSDSESELKEVSKKAVLPKKGKQLVGEKKQKSGKLQKMDGSSDDSDEEISVKKNKKNASKTETAAKDDGSSKTSDKSAKEKSLDYDSSDSETPISEKLMMAMNARSKVKDSIVGVESPEPKKQFTRSVTKKECEMMESKSSPKGKTKSQEKPSPRISQRKQGKFAENKAENMDVKKDKTQKISPKKGGKELNSSDSEEPFSQKSENKEEMREMLKKYMSKLDMTDNGIKDGKIEEKNSESCDSDGPASKSKKMKRDSESESEGEKNKVKKSAKKTKTELLEERVQKIKKQKNILDDKKVKNKKSDDKEELKEKEETIVSSSSQEPVTRSVAVQTPKMEGTFEVSHELVQKTERIGELEKELQVQLGANKLLEVELNNTRVILDRMRSDHEDEISELKGKHAINISEIKKKQWCYNCETEAIYHCCWNTAYCSVECQQAHWQSEHKRVCRRKRYC